MSTGLIGLEDVLDVLSFVGLPWASTAEKIVEGVAVIDNAIEGEVPTIVQEGRNLISALVEKHQAGETTTPEDHSAVAGFQERMTAYRKRIAMGQKV